jgi:hypothetical protein
MPPIKREKTVRWDSQPIVLPDKTYSRVYDEEEEIDMGINNIPESHRVPKGIRKDLNPYWEQEFELPEPEIEYKTSSSHNSNESLYITIDVSEIPPSQFNHGNDNRASTSIADLVESKPDDGRLAIMNMDNIVVDIFPPKAVTAMLGPYITKLIVKEMALRDGPTLPPPPRNPKDKVPNILSLRQKTVIHTYSLWAATFTFTKLIASIRMAVEKFTPCHTGGLVFKFEVRQQMRWLTLRTIQSTKTSISRLNSSSLRRCVSFLISRFRFFNRRRLMMQYSAEVLLVYLSGRRVRSIRLRQLGCTLAFC